MVDELQSCVDLLGTCLGEESKKACARSKGLFPNGFGSVRAYGVRWMMAEDFFTYLSLLSDLRDVWLEQQEPWELRELTAIHLRNPQYVHDWVTKARPSEELIQLRVGFDKEHSRIMNAAEGSSSDDIPLNPEAKRLFKTWAYGFDVHKRAAWKSAIKTLRRLCNGRAPRKVNDVIMFLTMSRVMTSIMDSVDGNSLLSDYDRDIGRWRVLFKDDPVAEHRFAEAVLSIWESMCTRVQTCYLSIGKPSNRHWKHSEPCRSSLWKEQAQFSTFQGRQISQDSRPLEPHGSRNIPMDVRWSPNEMERT